MKPALTTIATIITLLTIMSCKKDSDLIQTYPATSQQAGGQQGFFGRSNARLSGNSYSQSISIDTANRMLTSYLNGVGYPGVDTAVRSLVFDADTLRTYLANPNIATLKFMFAHKQSYMNSGHQGIGSGLNPEAITLIVVGLNEDDHYVPNNRGEVYDHLINCPNTCPGASTATIQL